MKAGLGLNIIGIIVVTICINTIGLAYYGLDTFPEWASLGGGEDRCNPVPITNATLLSTTVNTTMRLNTTLF